MNYRITTATIDSYGRKGHIEMLTRYRDTIRLNYIVDNSINMFNDIKLPYLVERTLNILDNNGITDYLPERNRLKILGDISIFKIIYSVDDSNNPKILLDITLTNHSSDTSIRIVDAYGIELDPGNKTVERIELTRQDDERGRILYNIDKYEVDANKFFNRKISRPPIIHNIDLSGLPALPITIIPILGKFIKAVYIHGLNYDGPKGMSSHNDPRYNDSLSFTDDIGFFIVYDKYTLEPSDLMNIGDILSKDIIIKFCMFDNGEIYEYTIYEGICEMKTIVYKALQFLANGNIFRWSCGRIYTTWLDGLLSTDDFEKVLKMKTIDRIKY